MQALPTIPQEGAIALNIAQLASMAEGQPDERAQRIILDCRKALSTHLDALRWNEYAKRINRRSEAHRLRRRHQGRGVRP